MKKQLKAAIKKFKADIKYYTEQATLNLMNDNDYL